MCVPVTKWTWTWSPGVSQCLAHSRHVVNICGIHEVSIVSLNVINGCATLSETAFNEKSSPQETVLPQEKQFYRNNVE